MNLLKKIFLVFTIAPLFTSAQNYRPGFVITLKGDTIKGSVDFKEWDNNPESINFKPATQIQAVEKLTVNDISYFEVTGYASYKASRVSISLNVTNLQQLQRYKDTTTKIANVFLKIQTVGNNVSLYSFADNIKTRFYIFDSKSNTLTELINRIYFIENKKNQVTTKSDEEFKQQLLIIAQQYPTYSAKIYNFLLDATYSKEDLIKVCKKINNSQVESKISTNKRSKGLKFFVEGGAALNNINLTGNFPLFDAKQRTPNYTSPYISAGINIYPFPDVARTVLKFEISYFNTKNITDGHIYYYEPLTYTSFTFVQNIVTISPIFDLNIYNTDSFKIYAGAGFNLDLGWHSGNSVYNIVTNENQENYVGLNTWWFTIPIEAGFIINKHYGFTVSYILPASISNTATGMHQDYNYSFNLQTLKMGINYNF